MKSINKLVEDILGRYKIENPLIEELSEEFINYRKNLYIGIKTIKNTFKEELKELAKEIRKLKSQRKSSQDGYVHGLEEKRYDCRLKHISYCIYFKNRNIEQIEQNPRYPLKEHYYDYLVDQKEALVIRELKEMKSNETLCPCS